MKNRKLLQIVFKNTSTIDFSLPLLWYLNHKNRDLEIIILYCTTNKNEFLHNARYINNELDKLNCKQLYLLDFLPKFFQNFKFLKNSRSMNDSLFNIIYLDENFLSKVPKYFNLFLKIVIHLVRKKLIGFLINGSNILEKINPDIVLIDNREKCNFPGDKEIFNSLFDKKIAKILLPHAPHYLDHDFSHVNSNPFSKVNEDHKCDIWIPFLPATPWDKRPDLKSNFFYSGYPGFDTKWINYCKNYIKRNKKINVLYIGRKFLDKNVVRPKNFDFVTMDYDQALDDIYNIDKSFKSLNIDFTLIYKVHPSANLSMIEKFLRESEISSYEISFDTSYSFFNKLDLVISPYSTAVFAFAVAGIPSIILKSEIMNEAKSSWQEVSRLYENMSYYSDVNDMEKVLCKIFNENDKGMIKDMKHIRNFFPDGVLESCYERIMFLIGDKIEK